MNIDLLTDMAVDSSGGVWITGGSMEFGPTRRSTETAKYDAAGNLLWRARHNSALGGYDLPLAIAEAPLGAVVVAGYAPNPAWLGSSLQSVVKYDALGAQQWAYLYGPAANANYSYAVLVAPNGDIIVGGSENGDMCVRRLDGNGIELWNATYNGVAGGIDWVKSLAFAPNGDVLAAGQTGGAIAYALALMRVDTSGNVLWAREVSGAGQSGDFAYSVAVDAAGNAYAAGSLTAGNSTDQALVAYDAAGNHLWTRTRPGGGFRKVEIDPLGRIVAAGALAVAGQGSDFSVAVYAPNGTLIWSREWDGAAHSNDGASGLALDSAGNVYLSGGSRVNPTQLSSVYEGRIVAYDANGAELFTGQYGNGVQTEDVAVLRKGPGTSLYLAGTHNPNEGDFLTLRFDATPTPFCSGDGSGAACPCGNTGSPARGCANSSFASGARLSMSGAAGASVGTDTLVLTANDIPGPGLFIQGTGQAAGGAGSVFGDGLLCISGTIVRLGVVFPTVNTASYPGGLTPSAVHIAGGASAGDVRHYQCYYRDAAAFCSGGTFNLTQGLTLIWGP